MHMHISKNKNIHIRMHTLVQVSLLPSMSAEKER